WALSFWAAHLPGGASSARIVEVLGIDGVRLCFGIGAFLGHCYSPFMKFKGGKGVATALGVYLVVAPKATLLTLVVCLPLMKITGIVSIASLTGAVLLPIGILVFYWNEQPWTRFCVTVLLSSVVIYRHRANIRRLIEGTEGKKNDSAKS
ncbi:MAG TPA: glycerol-3-phosphate acyltransferase, partial [Candidatus Sumerlaeota bacterium]|nr:glycerol-3-phosphate acyltransferase [Candidatus Sumerlaeota bacterium]